MTNPLLVPLAQTVIAHEAIPRPHFLDVNLGVHEHEPLPAVIGVGIHTALECAVFGYRRREGREDGVAVLGRPG